MSGTGVQYSGGMGDASASLASILAILQAMHSTNGESYGAGALTNAFSTILLTANAADANSIAVPNHCRLSALDLSFDTVVGGATTITCYLSEDAAGLYPLTHPATIPWVLSATANRYVASYLIEREYRRSAAAGAAGTLYLQSFLNAGTVNVVARLRFQQ